MFMKMRWLSGSLIFQEILKTNEFKIDGNKDILAYFLEI